MTILYLPFTISVTNDNIEREATSQLSCEKGQKIRLLSVGIAPATTQDTYILIYRGLEQLSGKGYYDAIIDENTHSINFGAEIKEGEKFTAKAWSGTAKTIYGVFVYEIFT